MLRKFIFVDPTGGRELVLPVSPEGYDIEHGRKVNSLSMHGVGDVNLPGAAVLLDTELTCLLPGRAYPFNQPGAVLNPFVYIEQLEKWSDAGTVLRFLISDTPVNAAVLLDPIRYEERDGTNDLYCTLSLRGYRQLSAATAESPGNAPRAAEGKPQRQGSYTVQAGDTLSAIARRVYGDASLYGKLAAANGISNPNLIYPGQVLKLPDVEALPPAKAAAPSQRAAANTKTGYDARTAVWKIQLQKEEAMGY